MEFIEIKSVSSIGHYGSRVRSARVGVSQLFPELDINLRAENSVTRLDSQPNFGPVQIVQALLDHGANVNAGINGGETSSSQEPEGE